MGNKECYWFRVVFGTGSLGKSNRVCSVLCVRFRSSVETNKATADTRCTEPRHGISSTPCDRLSMDMLEALGSSLCSRLKGLGSVDPARSPTPTYKKMLVLWLRLLCIVWASARAARWQRLLPEGREQGWWRGSVLDLDALAASWTASRRLRQARHHHEPAPSVSGFMRECELMALLHLVGEGLEVLPKDAAHRNLADFSLCGQFGRRTEICCQLFPRVLAIRLIRTVLFLPWPGRLDVWPVSLKFLTTFQTVSRRI